MMTTSITTTLIKSFFHTNTFWVIWKAEVPYEKIKAFIISEDIVFKWYLIITITLRNDSIKHKIKRKEKLEDIIKIKDSEVILEVHNSHFSLDIYLVE